MPNLATEYKLPATQADLHNIFKEAIAAGNEQKIKEEIKNSLMPDQQLAFEILYFNFLLANKPTDVTISPSPVTSNRKDIIVNQLIDSVLKIIIK